MLFTKLSWFSSRTRIFSFCSFIDKSLSSTSFSNFTILVFAAFSSRFRKLRRAVSGVSEVALVLVLVLFFTGAHEDDDGGVMAEGTGGALACGAGRGGAHV